MVNVQELSQQYRAHMQRATGGKWSILSLSLSPSQNLILNSHHRGIPGGYVGALEARLIETEIALYKTICSLRSSSANPALDLSRSSSETLPEALLQHEQGNESKVLKMATWKRLPLSTVEEVQSWWDSLRAESGMVCVGEFEQFHEMEDMHFAYGLKTRHKSSLTL